MKVKQFKINLAAILIINFCGIVKILGTNAQEKPTNQSSSFADVQYLVLSNRTGNHVFTFATPTSFIQIQPNKVVQTYHIRDRRSVSLDFRTRLPHALLLYNGIKDRPDNIKSYELYIMLDQGQVKVKHLFGDYSTTVVVGKGLNRDRWHHVNVVIDPHEQIIHAQVDQHSVSAPIDGLNEFPLYGYGNHHDKIDAIIFVGGLNESVPNLNISYLANTFVGCIKNVSLATSPLLTSDLEPLTDLVSTLYENVQEGCVDKCRERSQPCGLGSKCINHFDHVECDCFHTEFKGPICYNANISPLNLHGYSYVTFTMYEWMDRVHSDANRFSMHFSTRVDDSMLFYAAGEIPIHNHVSVTINEGRLLLSIDLGRAEGEADHEPITFVMGKGLTDGIDHVLTINHFERRISVQLDNLVKEINITGVNYHFYFDPDIYIGGGGHILRNRQGLNSSNNFVGCLREVYYNEKSILWELHAKGHHARYHGDGEPIFGKCVLHQTVPITIPFPDSGFRISNPNYEVEKGKLELKFEFLSENLFGTLAYSDIRSIDDEGFWELKLVSNGGLQFFLHPSKGLEELNTIPLLFVKFSQRRDWIDVTLTYSDGVFQLKTGRDEQSKKVEKDFQFSPFIVMGTSVLQPKQGFVGCMRKVTIGGKNMDSRQIVGSSDQINDIALDNCKYIDACKRPEVCKHGGKCVILAGDVEVSCDCSETGYSGRHCHFANFKRTCEELGLLGYKESGVYKIDIDGNGPYPPVNVTCKFETGQHNSSDETKTIVKHNLANETDVWVKNDKERFDFQIKLEYREFTPEMLRSLISQSVRCTQYIKYECERTPLALYQYTSFRATNQNISVASIGDASRFACPCSEPDPNVPPCVSRENCNCDALQSTRLSDSGTFSFPDRVGITEMNFLVPDNISLEASSQITLGPLECVEANTQRFVVTFKTHGSFLEAPGWKSGDLAFSFRTTRSSAILLYQPLLHPQHNAFSVFLANEHDLIFRIHLNGVAQNITVRSKRILSGGEWQQVWIDYDSHQVRFQINAENQMITVPHGQQFGFFEGTIYVGGAPSKYTDQEVIKDGLIGCFRGLVMNGQVVDLYSYMKFHKADIIKNCTPSCVPNPCQNNGICHENWGYFTCQCLNPFAQSEKLCEKDINVDGLTFLSQSSFIKRAQIADQEPDDPVKHIMTSNIYLNLRTYDSEALVLYANDHLNNFVQIHIEGGTKVIFLWNNGNKIHNLEVSHKGLNHGRPIQIAVVRNETHTTLHVNQENITIPVGIYLTHQYSQHPWINPELEIFKPPRPFAPVGFYYQLFLGGFETGVLTAKPGNKIPGMLGCLRGLKIGNATIKIIGAANMLDVLQGCKMVCDTKPCQNGGVCIEDFQARTYSCECIQTSFFGKTCAEERGATFGGESFIRRRFTYPLPIVEEVEIHFGFFASYAEADTVIVTTFIPGPMYSLLFAITKEGHLMIREHNSGKYFGTTIDYQSFIDGKRHSVYYKRTKSETIFIVDQEELSVFEIQPPGSIPAAPNRDPMQGEAYIGGVNEAVPEMSHYKRFKGCVSNVLIKFPDIELSPIEEYMGNRKVVDGILDGEIFDGIKQEVCGSLTVFRAPLIIDNQNNQTEDSGLANKEWHPPPIKKQKLTGVRRPEEPKKSSFFLQIFPYVSSIYLGLIVIGILLYCYRINKRYKRRLLEDYDDDSNYFRRQQQMYKITPTPEPPPFKNFKQLDFDPAERAALLKPNLSPTASSAPPQPSIPSNNVAETSLNNSNSKPQNNSIKKIDDDNEKNDNPLSSSSNTNNKVSSDSSSSASDLSLNSLNNTQALDDKGEDDFQILNGSESEPNISALPPIEEGSNAENDDDMRLKLKARLLPSNSDMPNENADTSASSTSKAFAPQVPPICINEHLRTFQSPLATLAGPFYRQFKRASKDSILSLD